MSIRIDFLLRFRPCNVTQKVCLAFICSPLTKAMRKSFPFCILQEEIRRHLRKKEQKRRGGSRHWSNAGRKTIASFLHLFFFLYLLFPSCLKHQSTYRTYYRMQSPNPHYSHDIPFVDVCFWFRHRWFVSFHFSYRAPCRQKSHS